MMPAAAVVLIATLLAGCTSGSPRPNYSSASTSPSPATTSAAATPSAGSTVNVAPGAVEPTLPPAENTHDSGGALSFAGYYWRMVDWAYSTNNGDVLAGLYTDTCKSCAAFRSTINQNTAAGYVLTGGHVTIGSLTISATDSTPSAEFGVDVVLNVEELITKTMAGAVATSFAASTNRFRMYLGWSDGRWKIVDRACQVGCVNG